MKISEYSRLNSPTRSALASNGLVTDVMPLQNGGYISPPRVKRQFRDPYGDWWDKQERRNYGEPVHEDNDILGMFSPEEYTHVTPATAFFQLGCFVAAVFGLCGVVAMFYPDTDPEL
jgi:NADH dehydrogenase (ubiquinone) 1 beta subcomplex subunit 8